MNYLQPRRLGKGDETLPERHSRLFRFPERFVGGFGISIRPDKRCTVHYPVEGLEMRFRPIDLRTDGRSANVLDMIVCDRWCEVTLNGNRVLRAPWPSWVKSVAPTVKLVGMRLQVYRMQIRELLAPENPVGGTDIF